MRAVTFCVRQSVVGAAKFSCAVRSAQCAVLYIETP